MAAREDIDPHSPEAQRGDYGENLSYSFASRDGVPIEGSTLSLAEPWYQEISNFKWGIYNRGGTNVMKDPNGEKVGHYTAMVWAKTSRLGCGVATSKKGGRYYCCHYLEGVNVAGQEVYPKQQ